MIKYTGLLKPLVFTLGCSLIVGCSEPEKEKKEDPIRPVRTEVISPSTTGQERNFAGVSQAGVNSKLSFRVSGLIESIPVQVGEKVEQGQLVASLNSRDIELESQQAEAGLQQAKAEARNAAARYKRVRSLYESESASRNELDSARAASEAAQASVVQTNKQLELAQQKLSYTKLTSPVTGCSVSAVQADINETVNAGQTIVVVTCGENLEVEVSVPETLISQINSGDKVKVRFNALPGRTFIAVVSEVGIDVTGSTVYPVTVQLDEVAAELRAGMAADVTFNFKDQSGQPRIYVPSHALLADGDGKFVYLYEAIDGSVGKVVRRQVEIGEFSISGVHVLSGIAEGDRIITAGINHLTDGRKVKLMR